MKIPLSLDIESSENGLWINVFPVSTVDRDVNNFCYEIRWYISSILIDSQKS